MKIKACENCGKDVKCSPSNEQIRRFCSFECRKSIYTPEMKQKMSVIKKEQFANGTEVWNKGMAGEYSQEYRDKISASLTGKTGPNSRNWKGGISFTIVRNARMTENGGSHTQGEWETLKAQYNWTCPCCRRQEPQIKLAQDHIRAVAKGGSDNIENIQPLCISCNAKKHTSEIKYDFELVNL